MSYSEDTEEMVQHWHHLMGLWRPNLRSSIRTFVDVEIYGGWGLPFSGGEPLFTHQDGAGWSSDHIDHIRSQYDEAGAPRMRLPGEERFALLSFPGAYTFGHWYVDVCPRLETLARFFDLGSLKYLVPGPLPGWARIFLSAYGIQPEQLVELTDEKVIVVSRLIVPDLVRNSDYLPSFPHFNTFQRLRAAVAPAASEAPLTGHAENLFVIHSPMTSAGSRRTLSNAAELSVLLEARGFRTVEPATMSFAEQVAVFNNARLIVGEDSSALHNIIYSSNASLHVLNGDSRVNYLHLSICRLLGHDCSYQICQAEGANSFTCDPRQLIEWIERATV